VNNCYDVSQRSYVEDKLSKKHFDPPPYLVTLKYIATKRGDYGATVMQTLTAIGVTVAEIFVPGHIQRDTQLQQTIYSTKVILALRLVYKSGVLCNVCVELTVLCYFVHADVIFIRL